MSFHGFGVEGEEVGDALGIVREGAAICIVDERVEFQRVASVEVFVLPLFNLRFSKRA